MKQPEIEPYDLVVWNEDYYRVFPCGGPLVCNGSAQPQELVGVGKNELHLHHRSLLDLEFEEIYRPTSPHLRDKIVSLEETSNDILIYHSDQESEKIDLNFIKKEAWIAVVEKIKEWTRDIEEEFIND